MPKKKLRPALPKDEAEILEKGFAGNIAESKRFITDGHSLLLATGYHRTTVPSYIYRLTKAGLLNKNAGRFSLKEL